MTFATLLARGRRALRVLALCVAAAGLAFPAIAEDAKVEQGDNLGTYRHDRWMNFEGAPSAVEGIAQTPDGWIWLAATEGLLRFDGLIFEKIAPPPESPMAQAPASALLVTRSGELWVGYGQSGGIAAYRKGALHEVPMPFRPFTVKSMTQTPDGAIWAIPDGADYPRHSLMRYADGRWDANADDHLQLTDGAPWELCVSRDGTLWVTLALPDRKLLASLRPGARSFVTSPHSPGGRRCHADRSGRIWTTERTGILLAGGADGREIARKTGMPEDPAGYLLQFTFDSKGGFWGTTDQTGIYHMPKALASDRGPGDHMQHFTRANGLSSDVTQGLFVDRDDNAWIGTEAGLDRFRKASVVQEPTLLRGRDSLYGMTSSAGEVYVTSNLGIFAVAPGASRRLRDEGPAGLCTARGGGAWFVTDKGYLRRPDQTKSDMPLPKDVIPTSECVHDRFGRLWMTTAAGDLQWHDGHGWHQPKSSTPKAFLWDIVPTPSGDLAYTTTSDFIRIIGNRMVTIPLGRYDIGGISKIATGHRDMFVSGSRALLRIRGNAVARLAGSRFPWLTSLRGIVQTPRGETWLMQVTTISRVSTADLDRAFDDPTAPLDHQTFDARDGVIPAQSIGVRGMQLAADGAGRIWQLNRYGVSYIDPAQLSATTTPPPAIIRSLKAAGQLHRDPAALILAPGTSSIDIAYTALSYAHPERVRFRYRLEGVDENWVDAGDRRLASYANLGPGRYRFAVIASDNPRRWSRPATLDIEIRPTFLQSWPFKVLCGLAVLALLWLAYSLRLRAVAARIRARMAERVAERERIARELHDTLLQSVQSLTLRFQLAADELPRQAPARRALEDAIDHADHVIAEGRDRVRDLRPVDSEGTVQQIILDIVARQAFSPDVEIIIETEGAEQALDPLVLDEVTRIASEAIFNAWRHADARRVTIAIGYTSGFRLRITDDGKGIEAEVMFSGGKPGHFGLSGMRERALKLKGEFTVRRPASGGTEVTLTIPGKIAYKANDRKLLALLGVSS